MRLQHTPQNKSLYLDYSSGYRSSANMQTWPISCHLVSGILVWFVFQCPITCNGWLVGV